MRLTYKKSGQLLLLSASLLFIASTICSGENDASEPLPAATSGESDSSEDQPKDTPNEEETSATTELKPKSKSKNETPEETTPSTSHGKTLESAITNAYKNNTEIQEQRAKLRAADEGIPRALAGYKPTLKADAGLKWTRDLEAGNELQGSVDTPGIHKKTLKSADAGLVLNQNIYRGGTDKASVDGAESNVKAERARLLTTEQKILYDAAKAALDLYAKLKEVGLLKTNENVLSKTLDSTNDKFKVGEETRTSVAQAEAQLAEGVAKRQTAEAQLEGIKATYQRVTGLKPGNIDKPSEFGTLPNDLQTAIARARDNNPQILAAIYEGEAARHNIDAIHGKLRPSLDLTGGLRRTLSTSDTIYNPATDGGINRQSVNTRDTQQSIELRAGMPIYEAGAVRSEERQARENSEQKRVAIETARRDVVEKLMQAWQTYLAAKANIVSYEAQVHAFEISVEGTRQEMLVGSKILLDFLNEQKKLVEAQLNLVQAERDYHTARYQALLGLGLLTARNLGLSVRHYNPEPHYQEAKYGHF